MDKVHITSQVNSLFSSMSYGFRNTIIDPGDLWQRFEGISSILLTHSHFDHIYGLNDLLRISPQAKVYSNEYGREMLLNARKNMSYYHGSPVVFSYPSQIVVVNDGEEIELGNGLTAKAIFTPGHNPSCITWLIGDALFTGDSYIPGIKTVTNLPGGNKQQAEESLALIKTLAQSRTIYPGHKITLQ